ncbi:MAG: DUF3179 domain-containing (seleno)protein, partial [Planctomycetota bacterium]
FGAALKEVIAGWHVGDTPMMLEAARFAGGRGPRKAILDVLVRLSEQPHGLDLDAWYRWVWNQDLKTHPGYMRFKRELYRRIDPRFAEYFPDDAPATIRLDEVRWGGVRRDGIPPLKNPKTIAAEQASYLAETDIVFGIELGGQARAYPKRILAWHEMVKDVVGGQSINGVYCTLCGSMIVYDTVFEDQHHELGTSGFLYRSNKLMYDHQTKSMWSTLRGEPVIGELVGKGIRLNPRYVVTTTWKQWRSDHPDTDVLSLETGHRRDYGEGVAYRDYFATDELMFTVPKIDKRLKNKDDVFVVRPSGVEPIAFSTEFLSRHPIHSLSVSDPSGGHQDLTIVTDPSGASRVYRTDDVRWKRTSDHRVLLSSDGDRYTLNEGALVEETGERRFPRVPSHRA